MPNIRQQEKRVRTAARERLENLRYRSGIKTLTRRLREVAESGEGDVGQAHIELVRIIDRAAARGAIHKNAAARKKSQAARLAATPPVVPVAAPAKAPAKGRAKAKASA
jgi:small subunit ribosomal protein S20